MLELSFGCWCDFLWQIKFGTFFGSTVLAVRPAWPWDPRGSGAHVKPNNCEYRRNSCGTIRNLVVLTVHPAWPCHLLHLQPIQSSLSDYPYCHTFFGIFIYIYILISVEMYTLIYNLFLIKKHTHILMFATCLQHLWT